MSRGSRLLLGGFLVFCALCFLAMAPGLGKGMIACALFCGLGAVACFSTGSHPVTIRLLGGTVFVLCLVYLISTARNPLARAPHAPQRAVPAIVYGLSCFVAIGLPAGYAALTGRYPLWGRGAEAFHGPKKGTKKKKRPGLPPPPGGPVPPRYPPRA